MTTQTLNQDIEQGMEVSLVHGRDTTIITAGIFQENAISDFRVVVIIFLLYTTIQLIMLFSISEWVVNRKIAIWSSFVNYEY